MALQQITSDVLVVGGGIMGSATAYQLALSGVKTVLLERATLFDNASGRNGGGVRQQNRSPAELPLAMHSIRLWQSLGQDLGHDVQYRQDGVFTAAFSDEQLEILARSAERQCRSGLPVRTLDKKQAQQRFKGICEDIKGGNLCDADGHANPLETMRAYQLALQRVGVRVLEGEQVTGFEHQSGTITATVTDKVRVVAPRTVLCAGAHTDLLTRQLGLALPITPKKPEMMVTESLPPFIRGMIGAPGGYLRQAVAGNVHFGINSKPLRHMDYRSRARSIVRLAAGLLKIYPGLGDVSVLRTWAGITSWTPDALPIIDRLPGMAGAYLATGFSGHGFALGPGVGHCLAALVQGHEPEISLTPFALSRF